MKKELKIIFIGKRTDYEDFFSHGESLENLSLLFTRIYFTDDKIQEKITSIAEYTDDKTLLIVSALGEQREIIFEAMEKKCHLLIISYKDITLFDYERLSFFAKESGVAFVVDIFGYSKALLLKKMIKMYAGESLYAIKANDNIENIMESAVTPFALALIENSTTIKVLKDKNKITVKTKNHALSVTHDTSKETYISCEAENNWSVKWNIDDTLRTQHNNGIKENYSYSEDKSAAVAKIYDNIILHSIGISPLLYTTISDLYIYLKIKEKFSLMKDGECIDISL